MIILILLLRGIAFSFLQNLSFQSLERLPKELKAMSPLHLLFLVGSLVIQDVSSKSTNFSDANNVFNITLESFDYLTLQNKSAFILFYSERCSECEKRQLELDTLLVKLKESGLSEIVVGEADCCKEIDLCATSDKETKCLKDVIDQENEIWTLVEPEDVCIDTAIDEKQSILTTSVNECARKCLGAASHFAYGTNEFGQQGCQDGFCDCNCIERCKLLSPERYCFFKCKPGAKLSIEVPECRCDFRGKQFDSHHNDENHKYSDDHYYCWLQETPCKDLTGYTVDNFWTWRYCVKNGEKLVECDIITDPDICESSIDCSDGTYCDFKDGNLGVCEPCESFVLSNNTCQNVNHPKGKESCHMKCKGFDIVKTGFECESQDELLGIKNSVTECATACSSSILCRFFIYGTAGWKTGRCYWEKTDSYNCHEGWQKDVFDFYSVQGKDKPTNPDVQTSCYEKQDKRYHSLQSAWNDCLNDTSCKGVHDDDCDDDNWQLCYGYTKSSESSCVYRRDSPSTDTCVPYSKLACINAGIQQGLQLGGNGTKFIGNHDVKGCYVELGFVYYGIEEDIHEHRKFLSTPFYRPNGYDCDFDPCSRNPCDNGGICEVSIETFNFICKCPKNCFGTRCQTCVSAQMNFASSFPIFWFSGNGNQQGMQYKGPRDIDSLKFFLKELTGNGEQSRKNTSELIIEAGCRAPNWKDKYESYEWKADGKLLAEGACISGRTKKHLVPDPGRTRVRCRFEHEKVRRVDSRGKTMLIDLTLTMQWWDPNVLYKDSEDKTNASDIILSPSSINEIWTPDLMIKNLTSFKFEDEWIKLISSKVLVHDGYIIQTAQGSFKANVEITYEIKASIYCNFDHSKYPFDKQNCNLTLGSSSFGAIFVLDHYNEISNVNSTYTASNFHISTKFFDDQRHAFGNNTIGIHFIMTHSTVPYAVKYYIPCNAIVIISMISFTIPLSAIPGRVALLVTQFLTLTNLFIYEMSESPTVSEVNGLGLYLLCSLGFVFSALIEFAILITLKRREMNYKIEATDNKKWKINQVSHDSKKFKRLSHKIRQLKMAKKSSDTRGGTDSDKPLLESSFLQKIDYHSLVAYFIGYCFFNFCYWIKMLAEN